MNTQIDFTEKTIMNAANSGIIELLQPYDEFPMRLRAITLSIIDEGGVEKYMAKKHTTDRLKGLIYDFLK